MIGKWSFSLSVSDFTASGMEITEENELLITENYEILLPKFLLLCSYTMDLIWRGSGSGRGRCGGGGRQSVSVVGFSGT